MFDLVELQRKLQEARNEIINSYRLRTAAVVKEKQTRERDIISLLIDGYNADQAAYILNIPHSEVARIVEDSQRRRKFLMTGNLDLPGQMTGVSIFQ